MIKGILAKHDFKNVVEGTYISQKSTQKRAEGIYRDYDKSSGGSDSADCC
jgi:hypothetical protein